MKALYRRVPCLVFLALLCLTLFCITSLKEKQDKPPANSGTRILVQDLSDAGVYLGGKRSSLGWVMRHLSIKDVHVDNDMYVLALQNGAMVFRKNENELSAFSSGDNPPSLQDQTDNVSTRYGLLPETCTPDYSKLLRSFSELEEIYGPGNLDDNSGGSLDFKVMSYYLAVRTPDLVCWWEIEFFTKDLSSDIAWFVCGRRLRKDSFEFLPDDVEFLKVQIDVEGNVL
jgi:hypothetical protein